MMQRQVITVPYSMMRMTSVNWWIDWRGQPGSDATAGNTQTVFSAFPRWTGEVNFIFTQANVGQWRAIRMQSQGRVNVFRLFMVDPIIFNRANVLTESIANLGLPFSTGQLFSTGAGFDPGPVVPSTGAALVGQSFLNVTVTNANLVPVAGQIMSVNDWPFMVVAVSVVGINIYRLDLQMPLREAVTAGDPVSVVATGIFEAIEDGSGSTPYDTSLVTQPSMNFREVLNR